MEKYSESHKEMRVGTLLKVMKSIQEGALNKNEVRDITGLSWGSCSEIMSLLSAKKIIVPNKVETNDASKRGRKAAGFSFNSKKNLLVGIEVKRNELICSLVDFSFKEIYHKPFILSSALNNQNILKLISKTYTDFLIQAGIKPEAVLGVSISLTGGVDEENNYWIFTPRAESIKNVDFNGLKNMLPSIKYLKVEHDINAQASSVIYKNNWQNDNYVFLHFGEGVGMSFYNNGQYKGARGYAGEIGHIPCQSFSGKEQCRCGKENCFEALLSNEGIIKMVKKYCNKNIEKLSQIDEAIANHKKLGDFIVDNVSYLITMLTNLYDPKVIIVGGEALEPFKKVLQDRITVQVKQNSWLEGPLETKWFNNEDINCAHGTVINSGNKIIEQFIIDNLL